MKKHKAKAREGKALSEQGVYRPSEQLRINQKRSAQVYPHRLYTPDGVGNGIEYSTGFRRED